MQKKKPNEEKAAISEILHSKIDITESVLKSKELRMIVKKYTLNEDSTQENFSFFS